MAFTFYRSKESCLSLCEFEFCNKGRDLKEYLMRSKKVFFHDLFTYLTRVGFFWLINLIQSRNNRANQASQSNNRSNRFLISIKKALFRLILHYLVIPVGIEPTSWESESQILSIEIRDHLQTTSSESLPDSVTQAGESEILSPPERAVRYGRALYYGAILPTKVIKQHLRKKLWLQD